MRRPYTPKIRKTAQMDMQQLPWMPPGTLALTVAAVAPASAQQKFVAVTALVDHPAIDAVPDGVQAALPQQAGEKLGAFTQQRDRHVRPCWRRTSR